MVSMTAAGRNGGPAALPVGVAVDQPDGDGRDLAALGGQRDLAGRGQPCFGVVRARRRVVPAAAEVALPFDQRDRDIPWQRQVAQHLVGIAAGQPDLVFERGQDLQASATGGQS